VISTITAAPPCSATGYPECRCRSSSESREWNWPEWSRTSKTTRLSKCVLSDLGTSKITSKRSTAYTEDALVAVRRELWHNSVPWNRFAVSPISGFEYFSSRSFPLGIGEENSIEYTCAKTSRIDFTLFTSWIVSLCRSQYCGMFPPQNAF